MVLPDKNLKYDLDDIIKRLKLHSINHMSFTEISTLPKIDLERRIRTNILRFKHNK